MSNSPPAMNVVPAMEVRAGYENGNPPLTAAQLDAAFALTVQIDGSLNTQQLQSVWIGSGWLTNNGGALTITYNAYMSGGTWYALNTGVAAYGVQIGSSGMVFITAPAAAGPLSWTVATAINQNGLPVASTTVRGAVAIDGVTLTVDGQGVLHVSQATTAIEGVVKYDGATIQLNALGQLIAVGGSISIDGGGWNAATNTPTLASGVGLAGHGYVVTTAGTTLLDGTSSWTVGDQLVFLGGRWVHVPVVPGAVISVAGRNGVIVLGAPDIAYTAPGAGAVLQSLQQLLTGFLTTGAYGAANDGSNQTTAVNAAAAEARALAAPLLIPPGTSYTGSLAGTPRFEIITSTPVEREYLGIFGYYLSKGIAVGFGLFGNSTYWGTDISLGGAQSPLNIPAQLQVQLNSYYGNNCASVTNYALGGTDSSMMLAGTDGSGLTYRQRVAAFGGSVIFVNHVINDAYHNIGEVTYKSNLLEIIEINHEFGITTVFDTGPPTGAYNPDLSYLGLTGDPATTELAISVQSYAEIMRQTAREMGILLLDTYKIVKSYMGAGFNYYTYMPDGVHPIGALYQILAGHLAALFISPAILSADNSILSAGLADQLTPNGGNGGFKAAPASRTGVYRQIDGGTGGQGAQIPFLIEKPGQDVYLAHIIWSAGLTNSGVTLDGVAIGDLNTLNVALTTDVAVDVETMVASNIAPGLHMLTLTGPALSALGYFYLIMRPNRSGAPRGNVPMTGSYGGSSQPLPPYNIRHLLWRSESIIGSGIAGNEQVVALPDVPLSCFIEQQHVSFSAQFVKGGGLALACYILSDVATLSYLGARPGLVVGLDETTGFFVVRESQGNSTVKTVAPTPLPSGGATIDLSAGTHTYDVFWAATGGAHGFGTLAISVDNGLYNFTYNLLAGWAGGCAGLYMMNTTGSTNVVTVTDFSLLVP